ncbi:MAG TPA: ATP-binding protein [candidate division Zixibacteria bacterium]|nr:ATP-binding protein [candidate division Zixibacteria bacterium]
MKSAFGSRLFRLFLLFSIIPSVLIALLGYYIASETTDLLSSDKSGEHRQVRLLHQRLNMVLENVILEAGDHAVNLPLAADFLYIESTTTTQPGTLYSLVANDDLSSFCKGHARDNEVGLLRLDTLTIQYVARTLGEKRYLAGFLHSADYMQKLQESEHGSVNQSGEIKSYYTLFIGLLLLAVLAITSLLAWFFSRRMAGGLARPIAELDIAAGRITNGQFGEQLSVDAEGELATLVESFNRMSARLQETTQRLAQTERVAAWRTVARRFAHELKNPLQPILISLHRIQKLSAESDLNAQLSEPLRAASEEVSHLQQLADRFSQLAKMPDPKPTACNLNQLVTSMAELYRDQMTDRDFRVTCTASSLPVNLDETYFREVIHNLLRNALDATGISDLIEISAADKGDTIHLCVRDSGRGMNPETVESARLPYFSTKQQGHGLGLAIVEKIVTDAGGTLTIQSEPDLGTQITISLPRAGVEND